uniref:Small ubiquitin like modifier 2b n=1 Tax=Cyprinus carpio carpio TaxID=630221 RepID=A0A8C1E2F7_CYPCA
MADEKPKEGVKTENNDHINLKVAGQDGSVVQFKIKRHTPLSKLMKAYCERQSSRLLALSLPHARFKVSSMSERVRERTMTLMFTYSKERDTGSLFRSRSAHQKGTQAL